MLRIENITKIFEPGTVSEKTALVNLDLTLNEGDFVTVIGGNGAGKSSLLNAISSFFVNEGAIFIDDIDITYQPEYKQADRQVFQDPMMGTAGNMTIEENLAIALRGRLEPELGYGKASMTSFDQLAELGWDSKIIKRKSDFSGGQRQALTLMATIKKPKLLLLDEHTAALIRYR